jgi:hypothetical protein
MTQYLSAKTGQVHLAKQLDVDWAAYDREVSSK